MYLILLIWNIEECFQSVSDGKALVASAITDKGVTTASDATFATMATNIASIKAVTCLAILNAGAYSGGSSSNGIN